MDTIEKIIAVYSLTEQQELAVMEKNKNLVVTAGAGSGKTRTLVARYLRMLAEGYHPREILAITFTKKAASEMRSRVRNEIRNLSQQDEERSLFWKQLETAMDSARIGTIHSLCMDIIHSHPVEAGVDPQSQVLEEGLATVEKINTVRDALRVAAVDIVYKPLFEQITINRLESLLRFILNRRLDIADNPVDFNSEGIIEKAIRAYIDHKVVKHIMALFQNAVDDGSLVEDAGDRLAENIINLIDEHNKAVENLKDGNVFEAAMHLFGMRRSSMALNVGKRESCIKEHLKELRVFYDEILAPWLGGDNSNDPGVDFEIEKKIETIVVPLLELIKHTIQLYETRLRNSRSLDFDDLEKISLDILADQTVQQKWQSEIKAILVDEFQDTNQRQRDIIESICGSENGKLFVVGDARQSIYRFRGADVKVFMQMQDDIKTSGGKTIELSSTHRTHRVLLDIIGDILKPIMGSLVDPERPYHIPFTELNAVRQSALKDIREPFFEMILGTGEDAEEGRDAAAKALTMHLIDMKDTGEIEAWDDVALLFRSSSGFKYYENAFDLYGIPYVTVAGLGFYDRPEIRDFLNILRAVSEPWNDLLMAGLLRSPAFGVSDSALYQLRFNNDEVFSYKEAIRGNLDGLSDIDIYNINRVCHFFDEIEPLIDRIPVAELIQKIQLITNYKALFARDHKRLWNNLEKLENDARRSGIVKTRSFFEYIDALRDVGAREGEAPPDACGMAQLMTIHKAKGLEYKIVVIADASRQPRNIADPVYNLPGGGLAINIDKSDYLPLIYRWAKWQDKKEMQSEESRLLYVAATRAKDKLIINGYLSEKRPDGYLKSMLESCGVQTEEILDKAGQWLEIELESKNKIGLMAASEDEIIQTRNIPEEKIVKVDTFNKKPIYGSLLVESKQPEADALQRELMEVRDVRIREKHQLIGKLFHKSIQYEVPPQVPEYASLFKSIPYRGGISENLQQEIILQAIKLNKRLMAHEFWGEIKNADKKYHELPYQLIDRKGNLEHGIIDLLYFYKSYWKLIDFKTDPIYSESELNERVYEYREQMTNYLYAIRTLMNINPDVMICFLDMNGEILIRDMKV